MDIITFRLSGEDPAKIEIISRMKVMEVYRLDYLKRVNNLNKMRELVAYKKYLDIQK